MLFYLAEQHILNENLFFYIEDTCDQNPYHYIALVYQAWVSSSGTSCKSNLKNICDFHDSYVTILQVGKLCQIGHYYPRQGP